MDSISKNTVFKDTKSPLKVVVKFSIIFETLIFSLWFNKVIMQFPDSDFLQEIIYFEGFFYYCYIFFLHLLELFLCVITIYQQRALGVKCCNKSLVSLAAGSIDVTQCLCVSGIWMWAWPPSGAVGSWHCCLFRCISTKA